MPRGPDLSPGFRASLSDVSLLSYVYDATGNRLSHGYGATTDVYDYAADSHRLLAVAAQSRNYDAAGNATSMNGYALTYNGRSRLVSVSQGGTEVASYTYNGRGERVRKQTTSGVRVFVYNEVGQLLGSR